MFDHWLDFDWLFFIDWFKTDGMNQIVNNKVRGGEVLYIFWLIYKNRLELVLLKQLAEGIGVARGKK